jgi:outer membrane lipoprotein SlyB
MQKLLLILGAITLVILTACSPTISPNTYSAKEIGVAAKVEPAVIVSMRPVKIENTSGTGGILGAGAGAAAGSVLGASPQASIIGAIGGALVGGVTGHAIDKSINTQQGYLYILRTSRNAMVSVTQAYDQFTKFKVGQRVLIVYGQKVRIVDED